MQFSIGSITPTIIIPLRYYFSKYAGDANLVWNDDPLKRTMEIYEAFDLNRTPLQEKPRVVVSRGAFNAGKSGVSDNLSEAKSFSTTRGNKDFTNFVMYQGAALITVEARNKGVCELLADMVSHFVLWSKPIVCDAHGWKEFGFPLSVSDCVAMQDEEPNVVKFQVQIQVPWMKEEIWRVQTDGAELKKLLLDVHLAP